MKKNFNLKLFKRLLGFTKPYRLNFIFVSFSAIIISVFSILNQYFLKIAVDEHITPKDYKGLLYLIIVMILILCFQVTFQFLFIYFTNLLGQKVVYDLRTKLFKNIIKFKMSYYDKSSVGRLVTRTVSDMETIASIFSQGLFMIFADIILMVSVLVIMFILSIELSLIIFVILPFVAIATRLFQRAMKVAFNEVRNEVANLNSFVQERLSGIKEIQIFNRQIIEARKFEKINERHKKAWLKTVWYNSIFFPIADISISISVGLIVWYAGTNLIQLNSFVSLGTIFLFIQLSQMLFRPLRQIADKFNTLQMGMVAANRVFEILDSDHYINDKGNISVKDLDGDIKFENVDFSYVKENKVLRNININIKKGEKVAIVGATGSGKSTIIKLILRLYDLESGEIKINNKNIKNYKLIDLRSSISLVNQDIFLFADTIFKNITLFNKKISKKEVEKAAKNIGVLEFINKLPGGLNYNVKERGVMLSEGQRQIISFLRAYVSKPNILILDEATSSIDSKTEELIQFATNKIIQDKTSIIIAHRLSTIISADKIVVMKAGKIMEIGSHNELITRNGYYKKLYEVQFERKELFAEIF
ncbi:MAG: ABC transporter ATP-binding protein [Bacteroidota bacterium]|nr:ABC transporter ATP-binding protein [Bacteroidota bacterium]